jgi:hypothetical protein
MQVTWRRVGRSDVGPRILQQNPCSFALNDGGRRSDEPERRWRSRRSRRRSTSFEPCQRHPLKLAGRSLRVLDHLFQLVQLRCASLHDQLLHSFGALLDDKLWT